ncbi:MAG: histidine phosphatase family protein [Candidatus Obscuribacterales bacterium]|nr:histidine phosphatase family protein [Candidatus Obscuribacterales bacterium]
MTEQLHPEEKITTIIFVRHGDTLQTESGKLYNDHSVPLTEKGQQQAHGVAKWIPSQKPSMLLCSRADRVRSTAEVLSAELQLQYQVVPELNELCPGEWEGRSYLELKKEEPEQYHKWCQDPIRHCPPGGESIVQLYDRVKKEIDELIERNHGERIILVTHAGVIRSALVAALGMPIDNFWRISVPTGSISRVDYTSNFATVHYMSLRV